jgi:hypothetical protein
MTDIKKNTLTVSYTVIPKNRYLEKILKFFYATRFVTFFNGN